MPETYLKHLLGRAADTTIRTVWMLPQARPVGEPAKRESSFAGLPEKSDAVDPTP